MTDRLCDLYREYLACLNRQDWPELGHFVHDQVRRNGRRLGLAGYRRMLEDDFEQIPDLHFDLQLLVSDPPQLASRLAFHCTPRGRFLGLPVNGRTVSFTENVFYRFREERIEEVWSIIDQAAIEAQLDSPPAPGPGEPQLRARLALVILAVRDVPRAAEFYRRAFGWPQTVDVPVYAEFQLPGEMRLGLYQREAFAANAGQVPLAAPVGELSPAKLYLHPADLAAALRRALAAGGWGEEVAYLADPDGNVLALARPA